MYCAGDVVRLYFTLYPMKICSLCQYILYSDGILTVGLMHNYWMYD